MKILRIPLTLIAIINSPPGAQYSYATVQENLFPDFLKKDELTDSIGFI